MLYILLVPIIHTKVDIIKHLQIYLILTTLLLSCGQDIEIPSVRGEFVKEVFEVSGYGQLPYNILFPKNYNGRQEYPLFFFLHGVGERGNNNTSQLKHIAPIIASAENQIKHPAILVFPQCPLNDYWASVDRASKNLTPMNTDKTTAAGIKAEKLLAHIIKTYKVDPDRVYLNGISMGAHGTYSIMSRQPDLAAAAIGVCGGANIDLIKNYQHIPLQIFHGAKDDLIPVAYSRELATQLKMLSAPVKYTEYPLGKHAIWNKVYKNPSTLNWLFNQKKH